jgi:hypothetical protein
MKDTGYRLVSVSVGSWFRERHWFGKGSVDPISREQDVVNVGDVLLNLAFLAILRKKAKKRFGFWAKPRQIAAETASFLSETRQLRTRLGRFCYRLLTVF